MTEHDLGDLSERWMRVEPDREDEYRSELRRECPAGHLLHDVDVEPLAIRRLLKEIVYWVPDRRLWAWVHLTWTVESDPRLPRTELFAEWGALVQALREAGRG